MGTNDTPRTQPEALLVIQSSARSQQGPALLTAKVPCRGSLIVTTVAKGIECTIALRFNRDGGLSVARLSSRPDTGKAVA